MAEFFDARATSYDDHMRSTVEEFERFYAAIAGALPASDAPLAILDLGIGTGLELPALLARLPNARVTGIDLSDRMLAELRHKHPDRADQVHTLRGSFLDVDLGREVYDAVLSVMALHHHPFDEKVALYRRIHAALRPGGPFVNGDYIVGAGEAARLMAEYEDAVRRLGGAIRRDPGDVAAHAFHGAKIDRTGRPCLLPKDVCPRSAKLTRSCVGNSQAVGRSRTA